MSDGVVTLRERVRERLMDLIVVHAELRGTDRWERAQETADAVLREFAIRPVAWGKVGEDGEVEPG